MGWIPIWEKGGRRQYHVNDGLMRRHLPDINSTYAPYIELTTLAQTVSRFSSGLLRSNQALGPLRSFFNTAEKTANKDDLPSNVYNHLSNMMQRGSAMHKIRNHFTTIAYLCGRGRAPSIPDYLTSFIVQHAHDIVGEDYPHLCDWEHAIKSLTSLGPTTAALNELSRARNLGPRYPTQIPPSYSPSYYPRSPNYGMTSPYRGRSPARNGPRFHGRTMPPTMYPVPPLAPPSYLAIPASRGIMSGFPSPSVFAQDPLEAEIEDMRVNQLYLEEQMAQLQLDHQVLEEEVVQQQVGGYALQPQLTWPS
ncbi:hypothetical protein PMIN06_000070 [Paraphaeosphaeria minitans]